ncbi:MAG: FlgD immunoglobulin-like domain containing protein [candidate division WOR-3 bacterium]
MKEREEIKIRVIENKSSINIELTILRRQWINLSIYDLNRNRIKTIFSGEIERGNHNFVWDKTDNENKNVQKGVYFVGIRREGEPKIDFESLIFI